MAPVTNLQDAFNGRHPVIWANISNKTRFISSKDVMVHVPAGFSSSQLNAVKEVTDVDAIFDNCPPKKCFATIYFEDFPVSRDDTGRSFNYMMMTDPGRYDMRIDHNTWAEKKILPLQLAIDQVKP
jgi:hypothetical protein